MYALRNTLAIILLIFTNVQWSNAQDTNADAEKIKTILSSMNYQQKLELVELIVQLDPNGNLDNLILEAFQKQDNATKEKIIQYADKLKDQEKNGTGIYTTTAWDKEKQKFKKVISGEVIVLKYTVKNTGEQPLKFKKAQTACPCVTVDYPTHPIPAEQSATVTVKFDTKGKYGKVKHAIVLYDNSKPKRRTILTMEGEVIPIDHNPGQK